MASNPDKIAEWAAQLKRLAERRKDRRQTGGGGLESGTSALPAECVELLNRFTDQRQDRRQPRTESLGPIAPLLPLGQVVDGQGATVVGTVICDSENALVAPLSGLRCAYFDVCLWDPSRHGEPPLAVQSESCPFLVEDVTGKVLVSDHRLTVWVQSLAPPEAAEAEPRSGLLHDRVQGAYRRLTEAAGGVAEGGASLTETVLVEGTSVAAWGHFRTELHGGTYRDPAEGKLVLEAPPDGNVWVTDDIAGVLDELEASTEDVPRPSAIPTNRAGQGDTKP